jgi:hypothetical protein
MREKGSLAKIVVHSRNKASTKPPNWNKARRRRGGGLVLPINYGRVN